MPYKDPERRKKYNAERMALRRKGSKDTPCGINRAEMVEQNMQDLQMTKELEAALRPDRNTVRQAEALQVIGALPRDESEAHLKREQMIRELYPGIEEALKRVLMSMGLMIDHPIMGEILFAGGLEPLVRRALIQMGPVFEGEIARGGSLAPEAILEMKMARAKLGALMSTIAFRGLQMVDPSKIQIKDLIQLAKIGSEMEEEARQMVLSEESNDSARKYTRALMGQEGASDKLNDLLRMVAEGMQPGFEDVAPSPGQVVEHDSGDQDEDEPGDSAEGRTLPRPPKPPKPKASANNASS